MGEDLLDLVIDFTLETTGHILSGIGITSDEN